MATTLAWTTARREQAVPARTGLRPDGSRPGWRSHTFQDGVRSLTLIGPLDVGLAGRLWTRISELVERGCRRLIVDASAIDASGDGPALLAAVFVGRRSSYQAVVVAAPGSELPDLLPASVGVTLSLTDAHRQLTSGVVRRASRRRPAPAARISADERNALAVRQSLRWAERAAREGDYERALASLSMAERTEGRLPEEWQRRRESWVLAWAEQAGGGAGQLAKVSRSGSSRSP